MGLQYTTGMARRLPQHPETEREILGAVIVENAALARVSEVLSADDFSVSACQRVFTAMQSLAASAKPIEILTLWDVLSDNSEVIAAGGAAFIASLGDGVHKDAPVAHWARMVNHAAILRRIAYQGESLTLAALEPHAKAEEVAKLAHDFANALGASIGGTVCGVLASEIRPERVTWLWSGRIPLGKITILDGDPGLGKSALTLDLAARVTAGNSMPDGSPGVKGGALVLNAEDGLADTIVPRLAAMGACLESVRIIQVNADSKGERQLEIPDDIAVIEKAAQSVGAKLIIIDPLMAFLGNSTNSFRDQDIRRALAPIAAMAERLGAAVLIVRHLNKNTGGSPLYRGGGSIGIIGAARSGLLVAIDPDDGTDEQRILASTKANLGPHPISLRYSIHPHEQCIRVRWLGESSHRASSLLAEPEGEGRHLVVEEAIEFLQTILGDGPVPVQDVLRQGEAAELSERTIRRAKAAIGIRANRQGFGAGSAWVWNLPTKNAHDVAKDATTQELAAFEEALDSTSIKSSSSSKDAKREELAIFAATRDGIEEAL